MLPLKWTRKNVDFLAFYCKKYTILVLKDTVSIIKNDVVKYMI